MTDSAEGCPRRGLASVVESLVESGRGKVENYLLDGTKTEANGYGNMRSKLK